MTVSQEGARSVKLYTMQVSLSCSGEKGEIKFGEHWNF